MARLTLPRLTLPTSVTSSGTFGKCSQPPSPPPSLVTDATDSQPDLEESIDEVPPARILCTRSFTWKESFEPEWVCQLVPTKSMVEDDSAWLKALEDLPFTRFVRVIGQVGSREYYLVAVASSLCQSLCHLGCPLEPLRNVFQDGITTGALGIRAENGETGTHGVVEERRMAEVAFARNAAACVLSGHSKGLVQCLRDAMGEECKHLLAPMEWMVLLGDILTANAPLAATFVKHCRLLGLLLLDHISNASTESVNTFIGRTEEAWMAIFSKLLDVKKATCVTELKNGEALKREIHLVSLLCTVFKTAGGETSGFQVQIDGRRTANENLVDLGDLFDIDTEAAPLSIGGSDETHAKSLVLEQLDFMLDSDSKALHLITRKVPIGFLEYADPSLSHALLYNLPHEAVSSCLRVCNERYKAIPELQRPENWLSLFLYELERMEVRHPYLETWMTSTEGRKAYCQIKKRLCETDSGETMGLCLVALVVYGHVVGRTEGIAKPTRHSWLEDFIYHLDDDSGDIQGDLWEKMVFSFRRVAGDCVCRTVRCWLETVRRKSRDCVTDQLSDIFWEARLHLRRSQKDSVEFVAKETRTLVDAGRSLLLFLEETRCQWEWTMVGNGKEAVQRV